MNPLHGSDAKETAAAELDYFFPTEHTFCAIKPHVENRGKPTHKYIWQPQKNLTEIISRQSFSAVIIATIF